MHEIFYSIVSSKQNSDFGCTYLMHGAKYSSNMSSLTFSDSLGFALCPISPSTGIASEGGVNGNQRLI